MDHTPLLLSAARIFGPVLFLLSFFVSSPDANHPHIPVMAGITAWMAVWWLSESVHLSVTSLLPFILLPVCGIVDTKTVAAQYMDPIMFLFIGGFFLAFAIERHGLHERIAGHILAYSGHTIPLVLAGVMSTAWLISMWISNTATVMMLIAAVTALCTRLEDRIGSGEVSRKTSSALLIGLAYAASIGGMATLVGTPTNMIFYRSYSEHYGHVEELSFADWMVFATPVSLVLLAATWFLLSRMIPREIRTTRLDRSVFRQRLASLGPITRNERIVGALFLITAVLWFTRSEISVGNFTFRGWASVFRYGEQIQDGTIAIAISLLLFLIPDSSRRGERLLEWKDTARLPFEILLLFGSGFALSKGFEASGLSDWLANALLSWRDVPTPMLVLCIGLVVTLISEFASNVASIQLVLPILISLQQALDLPPQLLLIPATLAASCGFMLPVATAPNTIVFSSGKIKVREMAGIGIMIDVIAIALISGTCIFIFR